MPAYKSETRWGSRLHAIATAEDGSSTHGPRHGLGFLVRHAVGQNVAASSNEDVLTAGHRMVSKTPRVRGRKASCRPKECVRHVDVQVKEAEGHENPCWHWQREML